MLRLQEVTTRSKYFDFAIELIFNEWGDGNKEHLKTKKEKVKQKANQKCYVLVKDREPIGCFLICDDDIKGYKQYNPNLACVCILKKFRGQGYSRVLMEKSDKIFKKLKIKKVYLKTNLINFYDKFGWIYAKDIVVEGNVEKLYYKNFY